MSNGQEKSQDRREPHVPAKNNPIQVRCREANSHDDRRAFVSSRIHTVPDRIAGFKPRGTPTSSWEAEPTPRMWGLRKLSAVTELAPSSSPESPSRVAAP